MDPNAWKRDAENIVADLAALLRDRGRAVRLIDNLANAAPHGRTAAWNLHGELVFAVLKAKRPGSRKAANKMAARLKNILCEGAAASAPDRLRGLLRAQNG